MNGPTISPGPDLPNALKDHCVVNSDEWMKAVIIGGSIGGMAGPNVVDSTHIFCFDDQTWHQDLPGPRRGAAKGAGLSTGPSDNGGVLLGRETTAKAPTGAENTIHVPGERVAQGRRAEQC